MTWLVACLCDILVRNLPSFCSCPKNINEVKLKDDEPMYLVEKRCVGKVKVVDKEGAKTKNSRNIYNLKSFERSLVHGPETTGKYFPGRTQRLMQLPPTGLGWFQAGSRNCHCHHEVLVLKARKIQKFRESRRPAEAGHCVAELQTLRGPKMPLCEA